MKLTDRNVAALALPAGKDDVVIWDPDLPGFGVRLRAIPNVGWCSTGRTERSAGKSLATFAG
jgi:hypothetical protein